MEEIPVLPLPATGACVSAVSATHARYPWQVHAAMQSIPGGMHATGSFFRTCCSSVVTVPNPVRFLLNLYNVWGNYRLILDKDEVRPEHSHAKYPSTRVQFVPDIQGAPSTALISFRKAQEAEKWGITPPRVGPANGRRPLRARRFLKLQAEIPASYGK